MPASAYRASGTIHRARFVANQRQQHRRPRLGPMTRIFGVSQLGGRAAPTPDNANTTECAVSGESLHVYCVPGDEPMVECGGTVTAGALLKSRLRTARPSWLAETAGLKENVWGDRRNVRRIWRVNHGSSDAANSDD
jgi:hypothetical protein